MAGTWRGFKRAAAKAGVGAVHFTLSWDEGLTLIHHPKVRSLMQEGDGRDVARLKGELQALLLAMQERIQSLEVVQEQQDSAIQVTFRSNGAPCHRPSANLWNQHVQSFRPLVSCHA